MSLAINETDPQALQSMLDAEVNMVEILQESLADLELAAEDVGWRRLGYQMDNDFSRDGLKKIATNCRLMAVASPLVKRGLQLRNGYVWGQGVNVQARAGEADESVQDVNAVVQAFWDDQGNRAEFTSSQAQEENERALGTDGNLFFSLFTNPLSGRVQIRSIPFEEVDDKITNPQDRSETWFYVRRYTSTVVRPFRDAAGVMSTRSRDQEVKVIHPALGFFPQQRPRSIDGAEVLWDAPVIHVKVNALKHAKWGIPDVYAALPWARAYDGFLTDWARLVKALSKFAWKLTGDKPGRARQAAGAVRAVGGLPEGVPGPNGSRGAHDTGNVAAMGPGLNLEAIPKTGATIDSQSGKPLAAMVAAAMGVPVTMLLADPGTTGARAVAETLDKPTILEASQRRELWSSVIKDVLSYVIDQAIKAPRGQLRGTVGRDAETRRETFVLAGEQERTVDVDWPDLNELDPVALIEAIVNADSAEVLPKETIARLLLAALRVKDADEIINDMMDENGDFEPAGTTAGQAAVDGFRRGEDPAEVVA